VNLSRRQRVQRSVYGWGVVGCLALIVVGIVFPLQALAGQGNALSRVLLTSRNCRAMLSEAVALLDPRLETGGLPGEADDTGSPGAEVSVASSGILGWLFGAVTGVSPGTPSSFLAANLPLARSSYAGAIIASGRTGPGGGLSPGAEPETPGGAPATGVPSDAALDDQTAKLYLYGGTQPIVAIVHTHGSESFLPAVAAMARAEDPGVDTSGLDSFSSDNSVNMLRVGEELARYLAVNHGIACVQSRRLHDAQAEGFRLGAYERSLETMTEVARRYPSVKIMLDLHRDAPSRDKTTVVIAGVRTAAICCIVGTDKQLDNPDWQTNYDFARRLVAAMEQKYPGLSRGILVRDERYNQHVMARTILLEVGGQENTLEEIYAAIRALGDLLAQIVAEGF
jgi:stage II sporulation protein P